MVYLSEYVKLIINVEIVMIEVLIGNIASGKSTYCKKRAEEGWIILNDDEIVKMVHGGDYSLYDERLKPLYKSVETTVLQNSLLLHQNVVIDKGTNITVNSRKRWIGLASAFDTQITAVVFPFESPEIHAERRYKSDDRNLSYERWLRVASELGRKYEEPTLQEGFNNVKNQSN
jgi:predicted kinase